MLYKRKDSANWWCKFSVGGSPVRQSTFTPDKELAEAFEIKLRHDLWKQQRLGEPADHTWDAAALRWLEENGNKRSIEKDKGILRWLQDYLTGKRLRELSTEYLTEIRNAKAAESSRANANRVMALVRSILRYAYEQGMMISLPKVRMFALETPEPIWITQAEFERFVALLRPLQAEIARFAVATGLRRSNITHLTWERVDMARRVLWIEGSKAKGKKPIGLPLNERAMQVLRRRQGKHEVWVFARVKMGIPLIQTSTQCWRNAVEKAGLPKGFRFHDLRHTWASWHVQAGTSLQELQELGGWSSFAMVLKYAHLNPSHLSKAAGNIDIGVSGTESGTGGK